jgi:hypothetical protein
VELIAAGAIRSLLPLEMGGVPALSLVPGLGLDLALARLGWNLATPAGARSDPSGEESGWVTWLSLGPLLLAAVRWLRRRVIGR